MTHQESHSLAGGERVPECRPQRLMMNLVEEPADAEAALTELENVLAYFGIGLPEARVVRPCERCTESRPCSYIALGSIQVEEAREWVAAIREALRRDLPEIRHATAGGSDPATTAAPAAT
ncbi:hypothetical protein RKE29_10900 [Streptomyces sp. B1866]|uniref:hypothetical protein n=1 Tax=Streptomyces sp. B1866 TaxID=3075431 RepID=UPI002891B0AE|nr:hypothetical protein [Streptomyces sp. B1866]MDT3397148.1 hypothetical protein [Streptomyces sp. B1866]